MFVAAAPLEEVLLAADALPVLALDPVPAPDPAAAEAPVVAAPEVPAVTELPPLLALPLEGVFVAVAALPVIGPSP